MAETLISLDESKQPARSELPQPKHPGAPELRRLGIILVGLIFLTALVLLIWIIVSLFSSRFSLDSLPIIGSGGTIKDLSL
ncbi:MAG: hypothetical protein WD157_00635 [Patescibacteria group bacterium]